MMVARDGVGLCVLNDLTQVVEPSLLELLKLLTRSSRCVSHVCHNFGCHRSHVRLISEVVKSRSRTKHGHPGVGNASIFCSTHAASPPLLRRFGLDLSATTEHKEDHFDPSIGLATQFKKGNPSANPGGRPKSTLISQALRAKMAEVKEDDPQRRTYAEILAQNLVETAACRSPTAVAAMNLIVDRLEGRARQQIEVADVTRQLQDKSDYELQFYLDHGRWPEEEDAEAPGRTH